VRKCACSKHLFAQHPFSRTFFLFSLQRFLPLCAHSKILRHTVSDEQKRCFEATLTVGLPPLFEETYVSDVTVIDSELTVETVSIQSNLFDSLKSRWQLSPIITEENNSDQQQHCNVAFEVELTVSDPLIKNTLDQVLQQVAGRQVEAFATRCRQIPVAHDDLQIMRRQ